MKLEALKRQGKCTSRQLVGKYESADKISDTKAVDRFSDGATAVSGHVEWHCCI